MRNRRLATVSTIALLIALSVGITRSGSAQSQSAPPRNPGRFVAITPPAASENAYPNFLWVLDTATGDVRAHRIASVNDDTGKHAAWITEDIPTAQQYVRSKSGQ